MQNVSVIVTAGGIGKRMGSEVPKQFLTINSQPILYYTLLFFHQQKEVTQLILTLPEEWQSYWKSECKKFPIQIPHQIVNGGLERFHSIKNALDVCLEPIVAIHDGVRPLVSEKTWENCIEAIKMNSAVVPVTQLKESIRHLNENGSKSVNREKYRNVQTPQLFELNQLKAAYQRPFSTSFTDDASVIEQFGVPIYLVDGNDENIKITTPMDLQIATLFMQKKEK